MQAKRQVRFRWTLRDQDRESVGSPTKIEKPMENFTRNEEKSALSVCLQILHANNLYRLTLETSKSGWPQCLQTKEKLLKRKQLRPSRFGQGDQHQRPYS